MIFGFQIKAGRGIVKMSQLDLSERSGVSVPAIQNIEADEEKAKKAKQETIRKLKNALEQAGVRFIRAKDENGNGAGVVLQLENKKSTDNQDS